ncbi:hypothetical protein T08_9241 [Trichinella sp. T8]|nr:hypothetical protein T08_9241 [Trichinella sp. T8]
MPRISVMTYYWERAFQFVSSTSQPRISDDINPRTLFRTAYKSQRFGIRVAYLIPWKQSVEADELVRLVPS